MEFNDQGDINLLKNNAFQIQILSLPTVMMFTQTVNIPGIIMGSIPLALPTADVSIPGDKLVFENLSLTFMVDENLKNYMEIWNWMESLGFPQTTDEFGKLRNPGRPVDAIRETSDIKIALLTNKTNYNKEITFVDAFPVDLDALSFAYNEDGITHPTATVGFEYKYYYFGNYGDTWK